MQNNNGLKNSGNMYANAESWNPFKGCKFDCVYCKPSFQKQATRQKHLCMECYKYTPHEHPKRLTDIPSSQIVFVCGNSDISFASAEYVGKIIEAIKTHKNNTTFYLQSKNPECLEPFITSLPANVALVTTLETNRDDGYDKISKAPPPSVRYAQFTKLAYPRKIVTIEPVMDFDVPEFSRMIIDIKPEYVWLGLNSKDKQVKLPEPSEEKLAEFTSILAKNGIKVYGKTLRGMKLPGVEYTKKEKSKKTDDTTTTTNVTTTTTTPPMTTENKSAEANTSSESVTTNSKIHEEEIKMSRKSTITEEQEKTILAMNKEGKKVKEIAETLVLKEPAIRNILKKNGLTKTREEKTDTEKDASFTELKIQLEDARIKVADLEKKLMAKADAMAKVIEKIQESAKTTKI